jgi:RNA polymerase primary sigma factor
MTKKTPTKAKPAAKPIKAKGDANKLKAKALMRAIMAKKPKVEAKKPELKKGNAKPVKIALKVPLKPTTKIVGKEPVKPVVVAKKGDEAKKPMKAEELKAAMAKAAADVKAKAQGSGKIDPKAKKNGAAGPDGAQPGTPTKDDPDAPLLDMSDAAVRKMITRAKQRGYVTYDELNRVLPSDKVSSEQIEDTMAMLNEMGINVIESEEQEETEGEQVPAVAAGRQVAEVPRSRKNPRSHR